MRCAQEAVTNAVRHSEAANLWLHVTSEGEGVRLIARNDGNAESALAAGTAARGKVVERVYEAPFLAHACMEPMNATAPKNPAQR